VKGCEQLLIHFNAIVVEIASKFKNGKTSKTKKIHNFLCSVLNWLNMWEMGSISELILIDSIIPNISAIEIELRGGDLGNGIRCLGKVVIMWVNSEKHG